MKTHLLSSISLLLLSASAYDFNTNDPDLYKFDAKMQLIDVTGKYRFIPPGLNDRRGPCPGLNAMANHGYLDRSGITTLTESANASNFVFGFDVKFARLTAGLGTILAGDPWTEKWSIGDSPPDSVPLSPQMKRKPLGLSRTHHLYESDASTFRIDAHLSNGDVDTAKAQLLKEFLSHRDGAKADYRLQELWDQQRLKNRLAMQNTNPFFFWGPFSGQVVSSAGTILQPELMSNHSKEKPLGTMSREIVLSFNGAEDTENGIVSKRGHERIPDNWYRRYKDLSPQEFNNRIAMQTNKYPALGKLGGAMGKPGTFKEVRMSELSNGTITDKDYYGNPNGIACGALAAFGVQFPKVAGMFYNSIDKPLTIINEWISPAFAWTKCPPQPPFRTELMDQFPGANQFGNPWW